MLQVEDKNGVILAYLNNLTSGSISEEMNGIYSLDFIATIDHLKTDYLYDDNNILNWNNILFYVTEIEELHESDDSVMVGIRCEHLSYKIMDNKFKTYNKAEIQPRMALLDALATTPFQLGKCEFTDPISMQFDGETNGKQILLEVAKQTKAEIEYDGRVVNFLKKRGQDRGTGFIFGKNLKSVKRTINLVRNNENTQKINYDISVVESPELEQLGYYEVGDTVRVIDERLNIDINMRIISVEKDIVTGMNNRVEMGDKIDDIKNSFNKVEDEITKVDETIKQNSTDWDKIKDITDDYGNIIIGKLNSITDIANKIVNSTGTFEHRDNALYWQDQPTKEASTFATLWSAQGIVFANSKTQDGEWIWQSALDAEGLTANKVTAEALYGMLIEAAVINGSQITGGVVRGVTIDGSTVMAGDIKMTGNITWDQKNSPVKVQYSVDGISDWHTMPTANDKYAIYSYDGGISWTQPIRIAATDGLPGQNGIDGQTTYLHIKYSNVANPTTSSQMNETGGDYIGQYADFVREDSNDPKRYTWTRIKGETGDRGIPGTNGTDGKDGRTTYFHIKYSPVPMPISEQMKETPDKYIGTYVDYSEFDSTDPQRYTWSRFEGIQGADGKDGIPGVNGIDGKTSYLHIKYSNVAKPTTASQMNDTGGDYIGQYTDFIKTDSDDPTKYTWTRIKGFDGADGAPGQNGSNGITYYTWYAYADNVNGDGFSFDPNGKAFMGIRYNETSPNASSNQYDYTWFRIRGIDGTNGQNGAPGPIGPQGPPGPQGLPGSDANVPDYIKQTYIDSVTIKSPRIEGNVVNAGVIQGGYVRGTTIDGSTIFGGDVNSVYTKISPNDPLAVYRPSGKVGEIWGNYDGSSYMNLYDRNGVQKVSISSGANSSSKTSFTDTGSMEMRIDGALNLVGQSGLNLYAWNRSSSPYLELFRSYMNIGNDFIEVYIDGTAVYIPSIRSRVISELEVQNMELMAENQQMGLKQSELEVTLMERGVL